MKGFLSLAFVVVLFILMQGEPNAGTSRFIDSEKTSNDDCSYYETNIDECIYISLSIARMIPFRTS